MLIPAKLRPLHLAARPRVIAHYLGQVFAVFAALHLVPLAVTLAEGRWDAALRHAAVIAALLLAGLPAARRSAPGDVQRNEALCIAALAFVLPPFLMAYPLMAYGIGYADAFFESVSGMTTTGLSVLGSVERLPFSFHFFRAWMQWVGGLGVIVLCLAFLVAPGSAAKHLGFDPREVDDIAGGTRAHARRSLAAYAALTAGGVALLVGLGMEAGDALLHALAAISTGGFSSHDRGLAAIGGDAARFGVVAICFVGAVPFHIYHRRHARGWRAPLADVQVRALATSVAIVALALVASMWLTDPSHPLAAVEAAIITAVSAHTTAGFSLVPYDQLGHVATAILIAAMLVGGGLGSTAGGIKVLRVLILLRFLQLVLLRCSVPSSTQISTRLGDRPLEYREIEAAAALVIGYAVVVFLSVLTFLASGAEPMASLFEVVSATGTVGLSSGLSGPHLALPLKLVLCLDMLMGRIEILALLVLLFPATWIGRRRESS